MGWEGSRGQSLIVNGFPPSDTSCSRRLHLMGNQVMLCDAVGVSYRCVVLIQASDSVHFVVDAAGDVLNVLHVGPGRNIKDIYFCSGEIRVSETFIYKNKKVFVRIINRKNGNAHIVIKKLNQ